MSITNLFYPQLVKVFYSRENGEIQLTKFMGQYQLVVNGLMESGSVMARVWRDAAKHLLSEAYVPRKILMLGVAGGSAIKVLSKKWPKAHIEGVDIDPVMIDIANQYFGLAKIPNLKIVIKDAIKFINNCSLNSQSWDLIMADCFKGFEIPGEFSDIKFLKKCVSLTNNFLINRLYWDEHIAKTDEFEQKIQKHFTVTSYRSISNKVFLLK